MSEETPSEDPHHDHAHDPAAHVDAHSHVDQDDGCPHCGLTRIRIAGAVAGVPACELVSERDRIVLGSSLGCDLIVDDPLVPSRAADLTHVKVHAGSRDDCRSHWMIRARPGTRVFVNRRLIRRAKLSPGDTFAIGCHQFEFAEDLDTPRDRRTNVNVRDLCAALIAGATTPTAFLRGQPRHRHAQRIKEALKWTLSSAAILLFLLLLIQPDQAMNEVEEPMEVLMVADATTRTPSPDATRSPEDVERREAPSPEAFEGPKPVNEPVPELEPTDVAVKPVELAAMIQPAQEVELSRTAPEPLESLPMLNEASIAPQVEVKREAPRLAAATPQRRLSVDEVRNPEVRRELVAANLRVDSPAPLAAPQPIAVTSPPPMPELPPLDLGSSTRLAMLSMREPSPLTFESYMGTKIPIARAPTRLQAMDVPGAEPSIQADGKVTDEEIAASWRSGQFRIHGPTPQPATPKTECYVSQTKIDGKDYFYVSFVCHDPDTSRIRTGSAKGVWDDDSVELFLDTNYNRTDYFHIIVNAKGQYRMEYCANGQVGIDGKGVARDLAARVKTTINPEAGQWTAEILIPFDRLGGVPVKGSTRWAVNYTRAFRGQTYPDSSYQNWFMVYKDNTNYHHPELYGVHQW